MSKEIKANAAAPVSASYFSGWLIIGVLTWSGH
jgi:hypothetical protein